MRLKVNISHLLIVMVLFFLFFPYQNGVIDLYMIKIHYIDICMIILGVIIIATDYRMYCRNLKAVVFMTIWLTYSLLQTPFCEGIRVHLTGLYYLAIHVYIAGVFIVIINSAAMFKRIVRYIVFFIAIHNVWGWYECIFHNYLYAPASKVEYMQQTSFFKAITVFYNLNDYAMVMLAGVFLTFILYMSGESLREKRVTGIIILSEMASVLYSESRGALLGLLMGIAIIVWLYLPRKYKKDIIMLSPVFLLCILLMGVRMLESLGLLQNGALSGSDSVRINLLKNAAVFLDDTIGFGIGLFNFEVWMAKGNAVYATEGILSLHNWWMEILVSSGVIIFVLYIRMYYGLIKDSYKRWKYSGNTDMKASAIGLLGYLFSFIISSISSSNNMNKMWLWVVFALIMAFQNIAIEDDNERKGKGVAES